MKMLALLTFAMLIASIVCDNNVANITTTESTISPALSESSVNQSASSLTTGITSSSSLTTVTPIQPNLEKNSTKPAQFPSNRIKHLNTTSFGVCNCDITVVLKIMRSIILIMIYIVFLYFSFSLFHYSLNAILIAVAI